MYWSCICNPVFLCQSLIFLEDTYRKDKDELSDKMFERNVLHSYCLTIFGSELLIILDKGTCNFYQEGGLQISGCERRKKLDLPPPPPPPPLEPSENIVITPNKNMNDAVALGTRLEYSLNFTIS